MDLQFFAEIQKFDEDKRTVFGYASTTALDNQGEIITKQALADALPEYLKYSNIREMHQPSAIGVAEKADIDDKGLYIAAKIIDDSAWEKVKAGVYKGFSIGGKSLSKIDNIIQRLSISEISLVDRPANPECRIELYKAELSDDLQKVQVERDESPIESKETKTATPKDGSAEKDVSEKEVEKSPESSEKSEKLNDVKKGMYQVGALASILEQLDDLQVSTKWEAQAENDNSEIPEELKGAVKNLADILNKLVKEETDEMTTEAEGGSVDILLSAKPNDLQKVGARNSKSDADNIQKMHDMTLGLGAECGGASSAKLAAHDDSQETIKKIADYQNDIKKLNDEKIVLQNRVKELEDLPVPVKGHVRAIEKGSDINYEQEKSQIDMTDPVALIKMAAKNPIDLAAFVRK